jgi:hypothetical protein
MATATITPGYYKTGPGKIYMAPLGSTVPTFAATSSVWSHSIDAAWLPLGSTKSGCEFSFGTETSEVDAAESFYPVLTVTTKLTAKVAVELQEVTKRNLQFALNGGTWATSGATTTLVNTYSPPLVGADVRSMFMWVSGDDDEAVIFYKVAQTGEMKIKRSKGADNATFACDFTAEMPASGVATVPWKAFYAGVGLGAAL